MRSSHSGASRPKLSVAMIVRDAQEILAETVDSVRPIADEIVVLDTGSTDRTVERASELGATVHCKPWANDFAAARNHCQRFASGSWVLWINAGEVLSADSRASIQELFELPPNSQNSPSAYSLWVESPATDANGSAEHRTELRLLSTAAGLRFTGRVRESVFSSLGGALVGKTDARLVRRLPRYCADYATARATRDLALATREAESGSGWLPRLALAAAESQSVLGNMDQARELFRCAVANPAAIRAERLEAHYGQLSTFDVDPELHASQLTACLDALEAFPFDLQLLLALGNYMLVRQRVDLAIRALDAAMRFGEVTESVWHLREVREIAAICLSSALQLRQDDVTACSTLESSLEKNPLSARLAAQLLPVYRKLGRVDRAADLIERFSLPDTAPIRASAADRHLRIETRTAVRATETGRRPQPAAS